MNNANLTIGTFGSDVSRLHETLAKQGFQIPASETTQGFFGPETRRAVIRLQEANGLAKTGQIDEGTAALVLGKEVRAPLTPAAGIERIVPAAPPSASAPPPTGSSAPDSGTGPNRIEGRIFFDQGL